MISIVDVLQLLAVLAISGVVIAAIVLKRLKDEREREFKEAFTYDRNRLWLRDVLEAHFNHIYAERDKIFIDKLELKDGIWYCHTPVGIMSVSDLLQYRDKNFNAKAVAGVLKETAEEPDEAEAEEPKTKPESFLACLLSPLVSLQQFF